jgi:hypothetical protein
MKNNIQNFEKFKLNENLSMSKYNSLSKFAEKINSKVILSFAELELNDELKDKITVLYNFDDGQYIISEKIKDVTPECFNIDHLEKNYTVKDTFSENIALSLIKLFTAFFHNNYNISDLVESDLFDDIYNIINSYIYRDMEFEELIPFFKKEVKKWEEHNDMKVKPDILKGLGFSNTTIISRNIGL